MTDTPRDWKPEEIEAPIAWLRRLATNADPDDEEDSYHGFARVADILAAFAALKGQTCETCKFAKHRFAMVEARTCGLVLDTIHEAASIMLRDAVVPLAINGQPFGCRGWIAKDQPKEDA